MSAGTAAAGDRQALDRWWRTFVRTGRLPAELDLVQGRLVRAVLRGSLPSGDVFVKVMTFPRAKDRLRYAVRALPAAHEARMLRAAAAEHIRCPEVLDVRTKRRAGMPARSFLVLRALPTQTAVEVDSNARLRDEATMALRLLAIGIEHRDLHSGNFVRLGDGELAVLDLQSASLHGRPCLAAAQRIAAAARLLRERDVEAGHRHTLRDLGLLQNEAEWRRVLAMVERDRMRFHRGRIRRCLLETTEFTRSRSLFGCEHRTRGELPPGRWCYGGRQLRRAWLGQRALHLLAGRPPLFPAFFQKSWWLGGGAALYVPLACSEDRIEAEIEAAAVGLDRHALGKG
ncbi:MAG: hypothetical protein ABIP94_10015 [Planctomycetota bacterium]